MVDLTQSLIAGLKKYIDRSLEKEGSINSIACQAGVYHTTIRRILSGETIRTNLETIRKIVEVVCSPIEHDEFLSLHFPLEYALYNNRTAKESNREAVDFFLQNVVSWTLSILVENTFTENDAVNIAGPVIKKYIKFAVEKQWMVNKNGEYHYLLPPLQYTLDQCARAVKLASIHLSQTGFSRPNHTSYESFSASESDAQLIKTELTKVYNLIDKIKSKQKSAGQTQVFLCMLFGNLKHDEEVYYD